LLAGEQQHRNRAYEGSIHLAGDLERRAGNVNFAGSPVDY
jgi:hypothetical protein